MHSLLQREDQFIMDTYYTVLKGREIPYGFVCKKEFLISVPGDLVCPGQPGYGFTNISDLKHSMIPVPMRLLK